MIKFLLSLLFVLTSCSTFSRPICQDSHGRDLYNGGVFYIDFPSVVPFKKYVIDLSDPKYGVTCWDDHPDTMEPKYPTFVEVTKFTPTLNWFGQVVPLPNGLIDMKKIPLNNAHKKLNAKFTFSFPPNVTIQKNDLFAKLSMWIRRADEPDNGWVYDFNFILDKDIHVGGTCVPSTYNQNVTLNNYNPGKSSRKSIGLSVHCDNTATVSYSLEGQLANSSDQSVFKNTAENGAKGIGIRFFNNGNIINKSEIQKIEIKGNSSRSLNLSTDYAVVKGESLTAGKVKSDVTVNLTYS
ncbi:fimbrial protein [Photobacterium leiognathi]|uniref:fimbrial protein n=1 Tax=Photobacterium leiognathi TaxID=553611 RepID=UPI0009BCD824|nr:fimbrial protein [Photobacterium leiognathi]